MYSTPKLKSIMIRDMSFNHHAKVLGILKQKLDPSLNPTVWGSLRYRQDDLQHHIYLCHHYFDDIKKDVFSIVEAKLDTRYFEDTKDYGFIVSGNQLLISYSLDQLLATLDKRYEVEFFDQR